MSCWDLQLGAQLLTKPVCKFPSHVSRNLNDGASLPLTPPGIGDQPELEWPVTLRLAYDSLAEPCSKRCSARMWETQFRVRSPTSGSGWKLIFQANKG